LFSTLKRFIRRNTLAIVTRVYDSHQWLRDASFQSGGVKQTVMIVNYHDK